MFVIVMPVSALFAAAVGIVARLVTPLEAALSAGLVVLVFVLIWFDVRRDGLGDLVGRMLVAVPPQ